MSEILYNADCLDVFKDIETESVDLVVTDCPYRIVAGGVSVKYDTPHGCLDRRKFVSDGTPCSNKWVKKSINGVPSASRAGKMFENNDIKFEQWLPEVYRVLKNGTHCYIMINGRNLKELQQKAEDVGFKFVNLLAWKKNNCTPNHFYMQSLEFILMLRKGRERYINNMSLGNCFAIPNIIGTKNHPTEKPVQLMRIFVDNSSNPGDLVLDPFMGTGSTGVACKDLDRNFIGIEIDPQFYDIAEERIKGVVKSFNPEGMVF